MNDLKVGFSTVKTEVPLGIGINGYYVPRHVKGSLDDIMVTALALYAGGNTALMLSIDVCMVERENYDEITAAISTLTGLSRENIFVAATHSHTAPFIYPRGTFDAEPGIIMEYAREVVARACEAAIAALSDMSDAKMGYAIGRAPDRIAYIRRYRMKDGSTCTCPPINDPNIDSPIGELDQRVNVLRFDRDGKASVVLLNYGLHVDCIGGEYASSDWVGVLKRTLRASLDAECIVFCGAQGDVGSTNVHPMPGDMNDTEISFDNEMKSPGMARFIGRALAGTVLQVYDKVAYADVDSLDVIHHELRAPTNMPAPEDMPLAREYVRLHEEGRDDLIPYSAMDLTTVVAEAIRMCELENGPEYIPLDITGLRIGGVALVGIPGEPFTEVGVEIKKSEGFELILPTALMNDYRGYFPMRSAFDEGGYEARTSRYKGGVAELVIEEGKAVLRELAERRGKA